MAYTSVIVVSYTVFLLEPCLKRVTFLAIAYFYDYITLLVDSATYRRSGQTLTRLRITTEKVIRPLHGRRALYENYRVDIYVSYCKNE